MKWVCGVNRGSRTNPTSKQLVNTGATDQDGGDQARRGGTRGLLWHVRDSDAQSEAASPCPQRILPSEVELKKVGQTKSQLFQNLPWTPPRAASKLCSQQLQDPWASVFQSEIFRISVLQGVKIYAVTKKEEAGQEEGKERVKEVSHDQFGTYGAKLHVAHVAHLKKKIAGLRRAFNMLICTVSLTKIQGLQQFPNSFFCMPTSSP